MSYRVLKLAGVALRAIHTTVFLMSDLRFDWHPSLSSPLIDERLELLVQEALKDYKSGSGIQPRATYEASYRTIGKHLISALYCAYHAKERVSLPLRSSAYGMNKLGRIHYSFRDTSKVREALVNLGLSLIHISEPTRPY